MNVERDMLQGKIEKKSQIFDDESIAMIWKEMWDNAQFEKSKMIGWQLKCNECGMNVEWIAGQGTI